MTRAKTDLHLLAPLKYYVTQQSRMGDRHVYGATSRFLDEGGDGVHRTGKLGTQRGAGRCHGQPRARPDVAATLRGLWS